MAPEPPNLESASVRDPVEELAEAFLERYRRGERPSLSEFTVLAPDHADEIRELFPALVLMEQAMPAAANADAPKGAPLERLGDYRVIREIGRGGMGIVYEAEQEALGRRVALKVLPRSAATDVRQRLRFRREARSAARLHHTNIVPVFDVGERDGVHYYAMQFIQGKSLDAIIRELRNMRGQDGSRDVTLEVGHGSIGTLLSDDSHGSAKSDGHFHQFVARIGVQIAGALAYAHGQRILHRDIKPSNLLLDAAGTAWVTDFGLAKEEGDDLTRTGDVVGTLRYMAPERFGGVSEPRGDIYSLGLTLYELLTFRPAFAETDRANLVRAITHQEPTLPHKHDARLPRDLETIVLKALAKEPAGRYAKAEDMEEDLRRFLADRPIRARRASLSERVGRWCRRNPGWAATVATVLGLLLIMAVGGSLLSLHLRRALGDLQAADEEKSEKLWQSYLERARALRSSGRVGQRFEALKVIREAAKVKITPELRDEAVAALVLPDAEIAREWDGCPEGTITCAHDASMERYARINKNGAITLCRLTTAGEEVIARLPVHGERPFWGLWMSPDGRFLAYGHSSPQQSVAGGVRVWKLDGDAPTVFLDEPRGMHLWALTFHADGRRLALGHVDGTISVYDLQAKEARPLRFKLGQLANSLAFHPRDGRLAAACGNAVRLLDVDAKKELPALRAPRIQSWSYGLAWHPRGRLLATTSDDAKIHIWDTETCLEAMPPLEGHTGAGIVMGFNHAGDRLLSHGWDAQTRLWDIRSGRLLLTMPGLYGRHFSSDDSLTGMERDGTKLRLWRLADGRELRTMRRLNAESLEVIHSPVLDAAGDVLAAASIKGLVFFEFASGKELSFVPFDNNHTCYPRRFHPNDGWLACGALGGVIWPARREESPAGRLRVGPPRVLTHAFGEGADTSADGRIRAFPQRNNAVVIDRDRPGWRMDLGPQFDVRHCSVSPNGRMVAAASWFVDIRSTSVRIWEAATGKPVVDLPLEGPSRVDFSPDGRWLATNTFGEDKDLGPGAHLWEVGTWRPGQRFKNYGCWSADGRLLAVHDALSEIRLVEPEGGKEVVRLTGPEAIVYQAACMTSDGAQLVATVSGGDSLYVWDLRLIRKQLRALGMDWELPESPSASRPAVGLSMEVDPGILRRPKIEGDRHAVAAFSVLLALQPINPDAHFERGLAYERLNDAAQAVTDYEAYLALAPSEDRRRSEAHLRLGKLYLEGLKNEGGAMAALLELEKLQRIPWPEAFAAQCNDIVWRLVEHPGSATSIEAAIPLARKALQIEPYNFFYRNSLGALLYRAGKYEEAAACLEKNLADSRQFVAFDRYFLAMSYERLGQKDKSRDHFDLANAAVQAETRLSAGHRRELAVFRAEAEALGLGLPNLPRTP